MLKEKKYTYLKFKKDHPVGIEKGMLKRTDNDQAAKEFIKDGYAERIDKEEYDKWADNFKEEEAASAEAEMKAAEKANEGRDLRPQVNEDGEMVKEKKKRYHKLSQADIEVNGKTADGFEPGDWVEVDKKGLLAVGADNKLIAKGN